MKKVIFGLLALTLVTGWASPGWAAGLKLTIRDGRVSLDAQDVTIRQILEEWARVGKTKIVNVEQVSSAPVTMKFDNLPESQALDIVLRALPGYWAMPRAVPMADGSVYGSISLMTTTTTAAAGPVTPPRPQGQPFYQDAPANVTQLRPAPPPLNPGLLPEPPDDPRNSNDPAIAAAAAAGLTAAPPPMSGAVTPALGPLQPPARDGSTITGGVYRPGAQAPTTAVPTPANPWNAPVGASMPGPATAAPSPTPPPNRPVGAPRPQPADQ